MAPNSTVIFNGTGTQHLLLPGVVYGNLIFQNSGTKLLYTAITVKGQLLIDNNAIFDAQSTPSTCTVTGKITGLSFHPPARSFVRVFLKL
jgi:hypothetical protein